MARHDFDESPDKFMARLAPFGCFTSARERDEDHRLELNLFSSSFIGRSLTRGLACIQLILNGSSR